MTTEPSILNITIKRWFRSEQVQIEIPARGPYEPEATKKQKHYLMKLGIQDPESIRKLGREQASFMIDQFLALGRSKSSGCGTLLLLCFIGFGAYAWFQRSNQPSTPTPPAKQSATVSQPTGQTAPRQPAIPTTPPTLVGRHFALNQSIQVSLPYGSATLPKGTQVEVVRDNGTQLVVRAATNQQFTVRRDQLQ